MSDNYTDTDAVRWLDECVSQIPAPPADVTKEQAVIRYCAGEIAQLRKEENYLSRLVDKQADILTRTANVLKGEPEELAMHSHHDLAEVAAALQARAAEFEAAQRADCINFHFWWMGAKGTNTYEGFETWERDVRPHYCQCGGPEVRGGNCESCEKPVPPIRYEGERR